ncbi:MAG: hypothetical protein LBP75_01275 [Planctomycetota bacterium]|jgi:hypothetical protein|nr:hypothetical protein [Planctomycetota bacterium]
MIRWLNTFCARWQNHASAYRIEWGGDALGPALKRLFFYGGYVLISFPLDFLRRKILCPRYQKTGEIKILFQVFGGIGDLCLAANYLDYFHAYLNGGGGDSG